jgi:ATP-dependent Clp protease protease subunit
MINSPGGDYFEGLAIYNLLREHPKAVTVQVIGIAAQRGFGHRNGRRRHPDRQSAMMFVHNSQMARAGDRHVMAEAADKMQVFDDAMASVYADRSGEDDKKVQRGWTRDILQRRAGDRGRVRRRAAQERREAQANAPRSRRRRPIGSRHCSSIMEFLAPSAARRCAS